MKRYPNDRPGRAMNKLPEEIGGNRVRGKRVGGIIKSKRGTESWLTIFDDVV